MPELPEVETTVRGIRESLINTTVAAVVLRHNQLRYPLTLDLQQWVGQTIREVRRRGKYIIFTSTQHNSVLMHLGMSGSVRLLATATAAQAHDHLDMVLTDGRVLRYHDPRRFGLWLWLGQLPPESHPLLAKLGPEPLSDVFDGATVWVQTRSTQLAIKKWLMNSQRVVGVGNIYANEALFHAGLHPQRLAASLTLCEATRLVAEVKKVLLLAIKAGGTTLKDFSNSDGRPGYFSQTLQVYGRSGQACHRCGGLLQEVRFDQRSTVFCQQCQT